MRALVRRIGLRYTVGLGLLLVLVVALVVIRSQPHAVVGSLTAAGASGAPPVSPGPPDDGPASLGPPPSPWTSPGADPPVQLAGAFAAAWLHHVGVSEAAWYASVTPYCTVSLAAQFAGVDPAGVPADRITGPSTVVAVATAYVQVDVPVNGGELVLGLRAAGGVWLVDSVDWDPS